MKTALLAEENSQEEPPGQASVGLKAALDTKALVALIFFEVAGGPYGAEPVVRKAGGAPLAILGFLLMPLVWSLPIAVMTAELCSNDPHIGGKIHFVHKAWGPWLGWQNGWFNAVSNVFDVATLPAMALGYAQSLGLVLSSEASWWAGLVIIGGAVCLNIIGIDLVGQVSYVFCCLVCVPPMFVAVLGAPELSLSSPVGEVQWLHFLTTLMWNTSGFDDAGATAAEVATPNHAYPRALGMSVALVTALYVFPLGVGASVEPDASLWHDGFLSKIGYELGGPMLGWSICAAGFLSSLAQLNALLCTSVREIVCMAGQHGQPVPQILGKLHHSQKTPHICTVLFGLALVLTLNRSFVDLIAATVLFDCVSFLIQFATWIRFRWDCQKNKPESFLAPLGFVSIVVWSMAPIGLCITVLVLCISRGGGALHGTLAVFLVGEFIYRVHGLRLQ
eukprot:TRINITY_DN75181_c0_g1_i1.p1 TRINITY_DN75181_c0_g1~~TRINITY_DN75181_c0_g1_i1.p1  ORF type:complete len:458 (-),score=75.88 TRINITY_DN75181_c0_g1_i1:406-1749(-)